jgi:SAM-dependent methyltransferase
MNRVSSENSNGLEYHRSRPAPFQACLEWDVANWSVCLEQWEPALDGYSPETSSVLALGERNGGLSLWFALQGYRVICTDRAGPTPAARALHREYGVEELITYDSVDVFQMPYSAGTFDIVACKSVIGGLKSVYDDAATRTLEAHAVAAREIHRVLRVGGSMLAAENMCGSIIHRLARRCSKGRQIGWRHIQVCDWPVLLEPFRRYDVSYFGFLPARFSSARLNALAYSANRALARVLPSAWMYIGVVRARK